MKIKVEGSNDESRLVNNFSYNLLINLFYFNYFDKIYI